MKRLFPAVIDNNGGLDVYTESKLKIGLREKVKILEKIDTNVSNKMAGKKKKYNARFPPVRSVKCIFRCAKHTQLIIFLMYP